MGKFSAQSEHDLKDNDDLVTQLVAKYGLETLKELGRDIATGSVDASAGLCGAVKRGRQRRATVRPANAAGMSG